VESCLKGPLLIGPGCFDWDAVQGNGDVELSAGRRFAASSGKTSSERYQLASFAGELKVRLDN